MPDKIVLTRKKLLIVDDDEDLLGLFKIRLSKFPEYRIVTASDSFVGYNKTRNERFNLIFTDYKMPKLNGIELIDTLRRTSYNENTPIVLMTPRPEEIQFELKNVKNILFLSKPINFKDLPLFIENSSKMLKAPTAAIDSKFLNTVIDSFQSILIDVGKFGDIDGGKTLKGEEKKSLSYDYFGSFFIRSDKFTGIFTLAFPRTTFFNFAKTMLENKDTINDAALDQTLDDMLNTFMSVFLSKTKSDMIHRGINLKEIHGITVTGKDEKLSSQSSKLSVTTKFTSNFGEFYIQIDGW